MELFKQLVYRQTDGWTLLVAKVAIATEMLNIKFSESSLHVN